MKSKSIISRLCETPVYALDHANFDNNRIHIQPSVSVFTQWDSEGGWHPYIDVSVYARHVVDNGPGTASTFTRHKVIKISDGRLLRKYIEDAAKGHKLSREIEGEIFASQADEINAAKAELVKKAEEWSKSEKAKHPKIRVNKLSSVESYVSPTLLKKLFKFKHFLTNSSTNPSETAEIASQLNPSPGERVIRVAGPGRENSMFLVVNSDEEAEVREIVGNSNSRAEARRLARSAGGVKKIRDMANELDADVDYTD